MEIKWLSGERLMFSWAKIIMIRNLIKLLYILREIGFFFGSFAVNVKREELKSFRKELGLEEGGPVEIFACIFAEFTR